MTTTPKKRKLLSCGGCAIGCGGAVIAMLLISVGGYHWATKKGSFRTGTTIIGSDSEAFVHLSLRAEDELFVDYFTELTNDINRKNAVFKQFPWLEGMASRGQRKDLEKMLPLQMEWSGNLSENETQFRALIGFSLYNNLADVVFYFMKKQARKNGLLHEIDGQHYIGFEETQPIFLSLRESVFYFGSSHQQMESMLASNMALESHSGHLGLVDLDLSSPLYGYLKGAGLSLDWQSAFGQSGELNDALFSFINEDHFERVAFQLTIVDRHSVSSDLVFDVKAEADRTVLNDAFQKLENELEGRTAPKFDVNLVEDEQQFRLNVTLSELDSIVDANGNVTVGP